MKAHRRERLLGALRTLYRALPIPLPARRAISSAVRKALDAARAILRKAWSEEAPRLTPIASAGASPALTRSLPTPVVVIVHAYYPDLLPEMLELLGSWGFPYELHLTAPPACADELRAHLARAGIQGLVHTFENRGRDILPFLQVARQLVAADERLILKLHTKRSLHRGDGEVWRRDLMTKLVAAESAGRIVEAMLADGQVGMVAPEGHVLSLRSFWGSNRSNVEGLAQRLGLPPVVPEQLAFVGGSMFWCRAAALRPLLALDLDVGAFDPEAGQVDGTLAHAIERVFALSVLRAGLRLTESHAPLTEVAEGRRIYLHAGVAGDAPVDLPLDFDPAAYLRSNPDVLESGLDPAQHYLRIGWSEGRRW